jgi:type IV/VI secretion system ImpK/VasF family protein
MFLATFRRNSGGSTMSIQELHDKLDLILTRVEAEFEKDDRIAKMWSRVHYPLVTTIDQVIITSQWKARMAWATNLLEYKTFQTQEGGQRFWRIVDEVTREQGKQASEMAEFLFRCVAFGFQGELHGKTREIELKKQQLYEKARLPIESGDQVCPEAYGKNVVKPMVKHPTVGIARLLIVCAGLLFLVWLGSNAMAKVFEDRVAIGAGRLTATIEHASHSNSAPTLIPVSIDDKK